MTREELKKHCEKQIENCEMWATWKGEEPHGKVYEEHKLILELLEQGSILDKIRAEIENDWQLKRYPSSPFSCGLRHAIEIINKYKAESEDNE